MPKTLNKDNFLLVAENGIKNSAGSVKLIFDI